MIAVTARLTRLIDRLACPSCHGTLRAAGHRLTCEGCDRSFPIRGEMPVLLDEASAAEIEAARGAAENLHLRQALGSLLHMADLVRPPHPFLFNGRRNRRAFSSLVVGVPADGIVLDIGSGLLKGLNARGLTAKVRALLVPLEIAPGPGIAVVGDAHNLPWHDGTLDGVLIQGVLEHVRDPERIVGEIYRALKPGAPVYAEVPFIQHYHLDPLDFRRFTVYGLEELFRRFERVDSGVAAGPASALADLLTEFPALLFRRPALYWGMKFISGWLMSPLRFLDVVWARAERAYIAAGGVYFLGRRHASGGA